VISFLSFMLSSFAAGLRVGPVDLVWGTSPPIFQGFSAWSLARLKRAAFLFEVRDLWPLFAVAVGVLKSRSLIRLAEGVERWLYHRADVVVVNSPGFVDHVRSRGARSVELVPNGVDVTMFDPAATGARFRSDHSLEGKYLVVYAGAHGISNDLGVVLDAARRLRDREDILFVLIGDGKEKPSLQARARQEGLSQVRFLPPVPKREMAEVLAAADACIAILKPLDAYKTTYPNKVFDYMAAARPVILAIDGAIRDVVETAGAGLFVPPGDAEAMAGAVQWLADHREEGRAMGRAGRKHAEENFHRSLLAARLERVMTDLVEART
jgi:glycosyltransferase involved in cell wall biosynthesis